MTQLPFSHDRERSVQHVAEGAVWQRGWLSLADQSALVERCRTLMDADGYVPTVRGGGKMHVRMLCLGRHWNPLTYRYESTRADHDGLPIGACRRVARSRGADCGRCRFAFTPDICLINFYDGSGRMGVHQDKDESPASIAEGAPVVSLSLGDTARFLFGGLKRRDPMQSLLLESGDAFVFGGPARLRLSAGVSRIVPGSAPPELHLDGRFNLTFRQF